MRWLIALVGLLALVLVAPLGVSTAWVLGYRDPSIMPKSDAIVVLSGSLAPGGLYGGATGARVDRAVQLWRMGLAPVVVMTGDAVPSGGTPTADLMVAAALAAGLPPEAVLREPRAQSTLQNALYTRDLLGPVAQGKLLIVTHRFHLPRSLVSFRWAGMHDLVAVAADPETPVAGRALLREGLTWPFNLARMAAASLALAAGVPATTLEPYLR
jgi:uncharacterized SAM-binding protein YcdF (DUF218 family)